MPTLEPGHVFERYRVTRWLGSGVSGESYEAEDAMLMRKVTLKLIQPQSTLPDSARRQFFRELQGTSALNHPYLAPILDYGELNGRLYIARKFVSNGSLLGTEGRLWFRPPLNEIDAIYYTHQLAQVLHYIHSRGYVHGALTFPNILVLGGPNVDNEPDHAPFLLADVGLAHFARRFGTEQKTPLPITAAPEQFGRHIAPASDQFALAVLLYFWLAGRPPYIGAPEEIEQLKLSEAVTPLTTLNPRITIEQSGILLRALSVYPEDRYPTIIAFADALLKTLPPIIPAIPKTEAAELDGHAASSSVPPADEREPEPEPVTAPMNEATVQPTTDTLISPDSDIVPSPVNEATVQATTDFDREPSVTPDLEPEPYVTPVLAIESELPATPLPSTIEEPVAEPAFQPIPETDPALNFEPPVAEAEQETGEISPEANVQQEEQSISISDQPSVSEVTLEADQPVEQSASIPAEPAADEITLEADQQAEQPTSIPAEMLESELQEVQSVQANEQDRHGNGHYVSSPEQESLPQSDHADVSAEQPLPAGEVQTITPTRVARVIITSPYEDEPYEVRLESDEFTIGRAGSSAILLDQDNLTSRHHALLKREGNRYLLFDLRSANGVFVNGQKIIVQNEYELLDGDHISIGNYELIFRSGAPDRMSEAATGQLTPATGYEVSQLV